MFHGDLLQELHIEDAGTPGFRKFLKKWQSKVDDPTLFVQFTKPRAAEDKRFVGQAGHIARDPYQDEPNLPANPNDDEEMQDKKEAENRKKLNKLKIEDPTLYKNPNHNDPIGLYAYPLEYVVNHPFDIAYGNNMEFLRVIKIRDSAKMLDLQKTTPDDIRHFISVMGWPDVSPDAAYEATKEHYKHRQGNKYAHLLWFLIQHEGKLYKTEPEPAMKDGDVEIAPATEGGDVKWWGGKGNPPKGNDLFSTYKGETVPQHEQTARIRKAGWEVMNDNDTTGTKAVIYNGEPEQALIISRKAYDVVDTYDLQTRRKTSYGFDYTKGIAGDVGKQQKTFPRTVAHKLAAAIGDKVEDTISTKDEHFNQMDGTLSDAVRFMNGEDPLDIIQGQGSVKDSFVPTFFKTKRGFMGVDIDRRQESGGKEHRERGQTNQYALGVDYLDERGLSHFRGAEESIKGIANKILYKHPQIPFKMKEPLTAKAITRAQLAIGTVKVQFEQIFSGEPIDFAGFTDRLVQIAQALHLPSVPNHRDISEDLAYLMLIKGATSNVPHSNALGLDNLTLDEDEHTCEQAKYIARMRDQVDEWTNKVSTTIVAPEAARDLKGKADWVYCYEAPGIYLKLRPDAKPIVEIIKWLYILGGSAGMTGFMANKASQVEGLMKEFQDKAEKMAANRPLMLACNPKNVGDADALASTLPKEEIEKVIRPLMLVVAGFIGVAGNQWDSPHKTLHNDAKDIVETLKVHSSENLANALTILNRSMSDLFYFKHIENSIQTISRVGLEKNLNALSIAIDQARNESTEWAGKFEKLQRAIHTFNADEWTLHTKPGHLEAIPGAAEAWKEKHDAKTKKTEVEDMLVQLQHEKEMKNIMQNASDQPAPF